MLLRRSKLTVSLLSALACTLPSLAFAAPVSFSSHSSPGQTTGAPIYYHADMNNDGREDLIWMPIPPFGGYDSIAVQLSNGDGTYGAATLYKIPQGSSGESVLGLAPGSFNSNGLEDVLVFSTDGNAYLYRNTGNGTLTLGGNFPYTSGPQQAPVQSVVGDFNRDSRQDVVYNVAGQAHVLFGNGNGGFTTGPVTSFNGGLLAIGDFDGDGQTDLLTVDSQTGAAVLYGDGTGHFLHTTQITVANPSTFYAADVNSDGRMDIVATQYSPLTKKVFVFYGDSARTLTSHTTIPTKYCPNGSVLAADLDGNGINDLIVQENDCSGQSYAPVYVGVLTRNSNASYNAEQTIYTSPNVNGQYLGIANGPLVLRADRNSKPDLLLEQCTDSQCYGYNNDVLLNTTTGNFPSCPPPNSLYGINVCSPVIGTSVYSPVSFAVGAAGPVIQRKVEVWVDGTKRAEQLDGFSNYTFLNRSLSLTPGNHAVTVYAAGWDNSLQKKSFTLSIK